MADQNQLIVSEQNNSLIVSEKNDGVTRVLIKLTYGAVTKAQLAYYEANLKGKLKELEADMILKYFYGIE